MKGTISSLVLLALELILCLISSRWGFIDITDSQICFKKLLTRFNTSSHHQYLHIGPLYSTRIIRAQNTPEHIPSDHAKPESALLITGIALIITSAVILSAIEFCSTKAIVNKYRDWLHFVNVILLTSSLVILIVGFYSLQHVLKQPLNGAAALGFFIGILFIVMLATHSAITFWTHIWNRHDTKIQKVVT
jgi:hypothetical protein